MIYPLSLPSFAAGSRLGFVIVCTIGAIGAAGSTDGLRLGPAEPESPSDLPRQRANSRAPSDGHLEPIAVTR